MSSKASATGSLRKTLQAARESDAFRRAASRLREGCAVLKVGGLSGAAKALVLAHVIAEEGRPAAVLTATAAESQSLAQELAFFLGLFAPEAAEVVLLPGLEVDPYRGLSPHPEIAAARALALRRILDDRPVALIAPVRAAAVRLRGRSRFLAHCLELAPGDEVAPEELRERLRRAGYAEDDPVTEPGEFSLRGGIVDAFPPNLDRPVRLEFFGDQLESLRLFDPETQRSVETIARVELVPMREYCPGRGVFERWTALAPSRWEARFLPHLEEELALARQGESFPGCEFLLAPADPPDESLFDYLSGFRLHLSERESIEAQLRRQEAELYERFVDRVEAGKPVVSPEELYLKADDFMAALDRFPRLEVSELGVEGAPGECDHVATQLGRRYHGNIAELAADLRRFLEAGEKVVFLFGNLGRAERMNDILREYEIPAALGGDDGAEPSARAVLLGVGHIHAGFRLPAANLRLVSGQDVYDEVEAGFATRRFKRSRRNPFLSDFRDLKPGDCVVHIDHGIGMFCGLKTIAMPEGSKEFVLLAYEGDSRLYVPVERLDLIQKYSNVSGAKPPLDRLGGASWERTKSRIRRSMRDMAGELLRLYAQRQLAEGFAFAADGAWQQEFEDAFEFELTPDQADAVQAVKHDMESPRPMDRLICGDVGYGKTEVAMRAAFKAVMDGKQAAVLAPTTVLAFQHFRTFTRRFTAFPVRIQLLSRFRSQKEQKQVLGELELGAVDIVVGTHRLLSKDVAFRDLGLVIVDEEQRFGVAHKERLKALKTRVDVLTLTATPIPRTLNMALLGLRDMSTIETPPKNRIAIQTSVVKHGPDVIRSAIELELARKGQVYFVHNRVETIHSVAASLLQLVPRARLGVAHGQMGERELERVMLQFVQGDLDILVSTTIIENGLDIPRVNTIVVNRADLYGLSQLYQLRGRVGRSDRRAYAYLLIPSDETLTEVARKRLAAIREFSDLGTGFRVAALDLEIRGAGNLLGGEQHGQIDAVGFDLYCRLLEQTVEEIKGEKPEEAAATSINLNLDIRIPESYITDAAQRLRMYKRISSAADGGEIEALRQEMVDRYGPYPEPVENLFRYAGLRLAALALQVHSIERTRGQIHIRFHDQSRVSAPKLLALIRKDKRAAFSPQGLLTLDASGTTPASLFPFMHRVLSSIGDLPA